ncbi:UDP-N-acetylenolpyruvoylglucosamine reductase [Candidatus Desantisbacteria bacterium CG1_02_38_46]|uniref:UDP-N-acetylenolpyruvoylglucosamine reductase n=3 Tax=unclassified Candidatus Desantisiibacteriota TaxID=3106372 RepID=A0A2H9PBY8_9BACT|nr:MAG: UDP-N-acetylenolpyruvoylglucosamine reductase [Candidatus Desantisbacteria bacterium CG1_02_38_46]PIU51383.1 MAG: UDP-N-acetylenolpyruvoylglucosamine reductase [Candidatus Desantisbacteria bacterium CG07_land_8_20_14_0_80_39_15]PIZ15408.1 MAG: UDP-N-acetylenolpyruvoylglucosamine reductase [Candidatus Desantisbacteria bacterium CG_4_10_14_0_8_um_filter_39_17]
MNKKIKKELEKILIKSKVLFDEPMRRHTSLRVGGPADAFILVEDIDELKKILIFVKKRKIPFFTIGGGTNLLVGDKGIKGIVLKLGRSFDWIKFNGSKVLAGPSTSVKKLLKETSRHGLSGLECIAGIPGILGGAIVANAGSPQRAIGDFVSSVKLMTPTGKIVIRKKNAMCFSYRFSNLESEKEIILEVALNNLQKKNPTKMKNQIALFLRKRKKSQPCGFPSAGCIFKNPPISPAGVLIDFAGLKGLRIGGAQISRKHANFILNVNLAKSRDISKLIEKVRKRIYNLFRIKLELEIEKVGMF